MYYGFTVHDNIGVVIKQISYHTDSKTTLYKKTVTTSYKYSCLATTDLSLLASSIASVYGVLFGKLHPAEVVGNNRCRC